VDLFRGWIVQARTKNTLSGANPLARLFCFLLALLVVAGALLTSTPFTERVIRPAYLGVMLGFFLTMGLVEPDLRSQGWRFLVIGASLLFGGSLGGVLVGQGYVPWIPFPQAWGIAWSLEHGVGFLLGFSVLSFGFVLWIPEIVRSRRVLKEGLSAVQRDREKTAEMLRRSMRALERAHDELIQAEKIAALGELAAGVAHDLRNPLAIIRSAAQACRDQNGLPDTVKDSLGVIQRSVDKADRTIRALLELGKPSEFEPLPVDPKTLLEETASLVGVEARNKDIRIRTSPAGDAVLQGDRGLLSQALINLALNAVQASPPGGEVLLGARLFRLGGKERVLLYVEDDGPGLSPETRKRALDPFYTTREKGTGLGLTVTQRVAARHGGKLALRPRSRGGTRALLLLPVEAPVPVEAAP